MTANSQKFRLVFLAVLGVLVLALVPAAFAGKGGGGGKPSGGGGTGGGGGTVTGPAMVTDVGTAGVSFGDTVTFNVSTTATDRPYVLLNCYQSGTWVSTSNAGFFAAYPWAPNFTLSSGAWTSGAGDCTAKLYMFTSNGKTQNLTSTTFHVNA